VFHGGLLSNPVTQVFKTSATLRSVSYDKHGISSGDRDCCAGAVPMRELSGSEQTAPRRSQALDGPARNGTQDGVRAMHDINRQNLSLRG